MSLFTEAMSGRYRSLRFEFIARFPWDLFASPRPRTSKAWESAADGPSGAGGNGHDAAADAYGVAASRGACSPPPSRACDLLATRGRALAFHLGLDFCRRRAEVLWHEVQVVFSQV